MNDKPTLPEKCELLNEFDGYILAQREYMVLDEQRTEYITWQRAFDGSVTLGHYFTELQAAKEDFVKRSELIPFNKAFTDNELAVLYKALTVYEQSEQADYDNKELCNSVESVRNKLSSIPDVDKYTKIKVLIVPVGEEPYIKDIHNDLYTLQDEVDGYIECVHGFSDYDDAILVCNEMGKISDMSPNRPINGDIIAGNFIILNANDSGDFTSLTNEQLEGYKNEFSLQKDTFKRSVDRAISDIKPDSTPQNDKNVER
jgi:hypothetical protein